MSDLKYPRALTRRLERIVARLCVLFKRVCVWKVFLRFLVILVARYPLSVPDPVAQHHTRGSDLQTFQHEPNITCLSWWQTLRNNSYFCSCQGKNELFEKCGCWHLIEPLVHVCGIQGTPCLVAWVTMTTFGQSCEPLLCWTACPLSISCMCILAP